MSRLALACLCLITVTLLWRCLRRYRYRALRLSALQYLRGLGDFNAEEGLGATMGNFGVVYHSRFLATIDRTAFIMVHRRFFRGGYPEGEDIHIVSVDMVNENVYSSTRCEAVQ